jgi:hypothetical protein
MTETPSTDVQPAAGKRPARGYSWPPFEPGHELSLRHGTYSPRVVGARAELVRAELLDLVPGLADDPESASPLALYCRAVAREELAHEAIEAGSLSPHVLEIIRKQFPQMLQPGNVSPRLLEAATAAARVASELGAQLGIGPRAAAELRQIRSQAALNVAQLAQQAPLVLAAIRQALTLCGLAERAQDVVAALDQALQEVTDD